MDRLKEVREAAARGIREYARTIRGAHTLGPYATCSEMESSSGTQLVVQCADEKRILIGFLED